MTRMRLLRFMLIALVGATAIVCTLIWNKRVCDPSTSHTVVAGSRVDPMHPFAVSLCEHRPTAFERSVKIAIAPLVFLIVGAVSGRLSLRRRLRIGALTAAICGICATLAFAAVSSGSFTFSSHVETMYLGILTVAVAFTAAVFGALGAWCARAVFA
jgi:hypothetical protein